MTIIIGLGWAGFFVLGYTLGNIQGYKYELKSVIGYMHRRALKEFEEVHDERE